MSTAAEMSWDEIKLLFRETDRKMREVFARFDNLSRCFGNVG